MRGPSGRISEGMCKCEIVKMPEVEEVLLQHRTRAGDGEWLEVMLRKVGWVQAL